MTLAVLPVCEEKNFLVYTHLPSFLVVSCYCRTQGSSRRSTGYSPDVLQEFTIFWVLKVSSCKGLTCRFKGKDVLESFQLVLYCLLDCLFPVSCGGLQGKWGVISIFVLNFPLFSYKVLQFRNDLCTGFLHFLIQHPIFFNMNLIIKCRCLIFQQCEAMLF